MNNGFFSWWERIDTLIRKGLFMLLIAVLLSQSLMTNQTVKTFISRTDKLEGKSIIDSQLFIKRGKLEVSMENEAPISSLAFYINGVAAQPASGRSLVLEVKDGDVIEVGGAEYNDMAILRITSVSENISVPELGKLIYVNNNLVMVDRVRFK